MLWSMFVAQQQILWGPCCISCCLLSLDDSTESVALFPLKVTVESCHLVLHGAKRRTIANQLSPVAHFY